jgi:hypothetical protein
VYIVAKNKMQGVEPSAVDAPMNEPEFTFEQLVKSKRFRNDVDVLTAVLDHDGSYTAAEVEELVNDFKNRKVVK